MRPVIILIFFLLSTSCSRNVETAEDNTHNVIVIIMDGARYSETNGDTLNQNTPFLSDTLTKIGTVCSKFYNTGFTYTIAGHTAITTGFNQLISNNGIELPKNHSIFQNWLSLTGNDKSKAWIITSKDKLECLVNCNNSLWKNKFLPSFDCGVNGLGSGYRDDNVTLEKVLDVLENNKPNLLLVNFKEPDDVGHSGDWSNYLNKIKKVDSYIARIWHFIIENENYSEKTTLFVTNDHGRHLDSIGGGFSGHGDDCEGCRHICLWAFGNKVKEGFEDNSLYDLRDLNSTISNLLEMENISDSGEVMWNILKN